MLVNHGQRLVESATCLQVSAGNAKFGNWMSGVLQSYIRRRLRDCLDQEPEISRSVRARIEERLMPAVPFAELRASHQHPTKFGLAFNHECT